MRMWLVPPSHMCRKHLLGEHVELHMLLGTLKKGNPSPAFCLAAWSTRAGCTNGMANWSGKWSDEAMRTTRR